VYCKDLGRISDFHGSFLFVCKVSILYYLLRHIYNVCLIFGPGPAGTQQADIVNPYHIAPSHMFVIHTFATRWQAWTSLREQRVYYDHNFFRTSEILICFSIPERQLSSVIVRKITDW